jgi:hypothetical protein
MAHFNVTYFSSYNLPSIDLTRMNTCIPNINNIRVTAEVLTKDGLVHAYRLTVYQKGLFITSSAEDVHILQNLDTYLFRDHKTFLIYIYTY